MVAKKISGRTGQQCAQRWRHKVSHQYTLSMGHTSSQMHGTWSKNTAQHEYMHLVWLHVTDHAQASPQLPLPIIGQTCTLFEFEHDLLHATATASAAVLQQSCNSVACSRKKTQEGLWPDSGCKLEQIL